MLQECPYCGTALETATSPVVSMGCWIAWGRCEECGLSTGCKSGETEDEARMNLMYYLERRQKGKLQ